MAVNDWETLASDYERARTREDSFDRILEWPAQRLMLGDVTGLSILDLGCGSGAKDRSFLDAGAASVVGVDISGAFIDNDDPRLTLLRGDLSDPGRLDGVRERSFDRILFLASLGYATDQVHTLRAARDLLNPGGQIIVQRSHPIRYAVERAEQNGTSLGEEYFSSSPNVYQSGWNPDVTMSHPTQTVSGMLNVFAAAGLHVAEAREPVLDDETAGRFPHKRDQLNRYLGVLLFRLVPVPQGRR